MKKHTRKRVIIGICVIVALGIIWLIVVREKMEVEAAYVTRGYIAEFVLEEAKTRLHDEYDVTMPFTGILFRPTLDVGDMVTSGQVVARADDYKLKKEHERILAQIEELEAQLEVTIRSKPKPEDIKTAQLKFQQAKIAMENAKKALEIERTRLNELEQQYQRRKELYDQDVIGEEDFERVQTLYKQSLQRTAAAENEYLSAQDDVEVAGLNYQKVLKLVEDNAFKEQAIKAQIQQVERQLKIIEYDLERAAIRAPVTGPVLEKYVDSEGTLADGTPIYRIGDMESIEIEADILSSDVRKVRTGQDVIIFGRALGENEIMGEVSLIYPSGFEKISTLGIEEQRNRVLIDFDNSEVNLRPKLAVDVKIIVGEKDNTLKVPEQAVFKQEGEWYCFKVEEGKAVKTKVAVGLRNNDYAEILSGLEEGDLVITELTSDLEPNIGVRPSVYSLGRN